MRHPDGTSLLCPDGECGGAACVRCAPVRVDAWHMAEPRRRALAAFGNVLATVGSAAPWTDVDDWAKLYRYTAKVHADTFARAEAAEAEVERLTAELARRDAAVPECVRHARENPEWARGVSKLMTGVGGSRGKALWDWATTAPLAALAEQAESAPTLAELCDSFGPPVG